MDRNELNRDLPFRELQVFGKARKSAIEAVFRDFSLQDPAQHFMLICIRRAMCCGESPSQRDLARQMQRSPATVTASLKVLERLGYVRRYPDRDDQRINRVELTSAGKAMADECCVRMESIEQRMLSGLSPEELEQLSGLLRKMSENLLSISEEKEDVSLG